MLTAGEHNPATRLGCYWAIPTGQAPTHLCSADWSKVEPLEYLSPFLEVINSPETSGPITAVALGSVNKFLDCELLGAHRQCHAVGLAAGSFAQACWA